MKFRDAFLAAVAGVALAASIGAAIAQTVVLPTVGRVDADDLVQVIKHGMPTAQSRFATAAPGERAHGLRHRHADHCVHHCLRQGAEPIS